MEAVREEGLEVEEFFRGTCILVTGATGSVGKVLVEKMIRSCSGLDTLYVLIRDKHQMSAQQRFDKLLQSQLFEKVRDRLDKIQLVSGDLIHADLGLSPEDREHLMTRINVVIHCAASIKFQNPLKEAFISNSLSTQYLLDFCKQIRNLKSVVYMSTAYCNANIKEKIEEKIYPLPEDLEPLVKLALSRSDQVDQQIDWTGLEKKLIPLYLPNTYVITKAVSEALVSRAASDLPICIVRPSIVGCCMNEPIKGWVDAYTIITAQILSASMGSLPAVLCDPTAVADIVPLEMVAHSTILAATAVSEHKKRVKVYHITTGGENQISWGKVHKLEMKYLKSSPPERAILYPTSLMTTSWLFYYTLYFFHLTVSLVVDVTLLLRAKKPKMAVMVLTSCKMNQLVLWVLTRSFQFCNSNMAELSRRRSSEERDVFKTDARQIDWDSYMREFVEGIKRHLLREHLDQPSPSKTQRQRRLKIKTLLVKSIAACCCYCTYFCISRTFSLLWRWSYN